MQKLGSTAVVMGWAGIVVLALAANPAEAQGWRDRLKKAAGKAAEVSGMDEGVKSVQMAKRLKDASDLMRTPAPFAGTYAVDVAIGGDTARVFMRVPRTGRVPFMTDTAFTDDINDWDESRIRPGWWLTGVAALDTTHLPRTVAGFKPEATQHGTAMLWGVPTTDAGGVVRHRGSPMVAFGREVSDPTVARVFAKLGEIGKEGEQPDASKMRTGAGTFTDQGGALTLTQRMVLADGRTVSIVARRISDVTLD